MFGELPQVESAGLEVQPMSPFDNQGLTGLAWAFLLLRSFASGCTALTGVEAISNGVPAFRKPKSKNAATTLALLGAIAVSMFLAITALALVSHVHVVGVNDVGHPAPGSLSGAPHGYV